MMENALEKQIKNGDTSDHSSWIESLLINYYDPMYNYQLTKKSNSIVFRGSFDEVTEWAADKNNTK